MITLRPFIALALLASLAILNGPAFAEVTPIPTEVVAKSIPDAKPRNVVFMPKPGLRQHFLIFKARG